MNNECYSYVLKAACDYDLALHAFNSSELHRYSLVTVAELLKRAARNTCLIYTSAANVSLPDDCPLEKLPKYDLKGLLYTEDIWSNLLGVIRDEKDYEYYKSSEHESYRDYVVRLFQAVDAFMFLNGVTQVTRCDITYDISDRYIYDGVSIEAHKNVDYRIEAAPDTHVKSDSMSLESYKAIKHYNWMEFKAVVANFVSHK